MQEESWRDLNKEMNSKCRLFELNIIKYAQVVEYKRLRLIRCNTYLRSLHWKSNEFVARLSCDIEQLDVSSL